MAKMNNLSPKRIQIDKANARVVAAVAGASFLVAFSLIASKALLSQRGYQGRVIKAKEAAVKQLKANADASKQLTTAYSAFVGTPQNIIGGNPSGSGDRDGDNAKIVLDALPSKYDFPALVASLEKLLSDPSYKIQSITGTDDEVNQQNASSAQSAAAIPMPFEIDVSGNYGAIQNLVGTLERSIRPIQVQKVSFTASNGGVNAQISAQTYYQPEKSLTITKKDVK